LIPVDAAGTREPRAILHICHREMLRPLRDQILRLSGFHVDSTLRMKDGLSMFWGRHYDLVLIDVEGEGSIHDAETLCSEIKTAQPEQLVAFVCNWRVAILTDCPDEILRTEFNPEAFVSGVRSIVPEAPEDEPGGSSGPVSGEEPTV
jgi:DNA-binding response OmpR family regulator